MWPVTYFSIAFPIDHFNTVPIPIPIAMLIPLVCHSHILTQKKVGHILLSCISYIADFISDSSISRTGIPDFRSQTHRYFTIPLQILELLYQNIICIMYRKETSVKKRFASPFAGKITICAFNFIHFNYPASKIRRI